MSKSATPQRGREDTRHRITEAAQRLAIERGFDGFTMDDLAEAAQVSRRTLFNHHASKEEAVLGPAPDLAPETMVEFAQGGPTGDLVDDLAHVVSALITSQTDQPPETWTPQRLHRIGLVLERNPQLLLRARQRYVDCAVQFSPMLAERVGCDVADPRVGVLFAASVAMLDGALDEFAAHQGAETVADIFRSRLTQLRDILTADPAR